MCFAEVRQQCCQRLVLPPTRAGREAMHLPEKIAMALLQAADQIAIVLPHAKMLRKSFHPVRIRVAVPPIAELPGELLKMGADLDPLSIEQLALHDACGGMDGVARGSVEGRFVVQERAENRTKDQRERRRERHEGVSPGQRYEQKEGETPAGGWRRNTRVHSLGELLFPPATVQDRATRRSRWRANPLRDAGKGRLFSAPVKNARRREWRLGLRRMEKTQGARWVHTHSWHASESLTLGQWTLLNPVPIRPISLPPGIVSILWPRTAATPASPSVPPPEIQIQSAGQADVLRVAPTGCAIVPRTTLSSPASEGWLPPCERAPIWSGMPFHRGDQIKTAPAEAGAVEFTGLDQNRSR